MPKIIRLLLVGLLVILLLVLVGPFFVPVPPLENTVAPELLGDADSQFIDLNGLQVHTKQIGEREPTFILLHGFGASVFSWREVMAPLAEYGQVIAYDRPAFGLTERPMPGDWDDVNPYSPEAQVDHLILLMDTLGIEQAILVGNSAGGTIAIKAALAYPERVQALILVDAAVYQRGNSRSWIKPFYHTPQLNHLAPLITRKMQAESGTMLEAAWHNPALITDAIREGYEMPTGANNWDRALWEYTKASRSSDLEERLYELDLPTLVVTGDDDRIVPTDLSIRLAGDIPNAELVVFEACGHVPQEECPDAFMDAVVGFVEPLR